MVSAAKTTKSQISSNEEIVTATADSSSIVSTGSDAHDGNNLSGNEKSSEKHSKLKLPKQASRETNKTIKDAEIARVHQSPTKSSEGSSSTGSSTWSVNISPVKKRFSLSDRFKRSTSVGSSPNNTERKVSDENKENDNEEVFFVVNDLLVTYCLSMECILITHTHTVLTVVSHMILLV